MAVNHLFSYNSGFNLLYLQATEYVHHSVITEMANDSAKVPLLAGLRDPATPINQVVPPRRRFRHSKSLPLTEYIPP